MEKSSLPLMDFYKEGKGYAGNNTQLIEDENVAIIVITSYGNIETLVFNLRIVNYFR